MNVATILFRMYEGDVTDSDEKKKVQETLDNHNVELAEAVALTLWSHDSTPIVQYARDKKTSYYVQQELESLQQRLVKKGMPNNKASEVCSELRFCDCSRPLMEVYAEQAAPYDKDFRLPICATILNLHIAANAPTILNLLNSALAKHILDSDLTVYRAVKHEPVTSLVEAFWPTSTSKTEDASFAKYEQYPTVYKMHVPAGTPCMDISDFSLYDNVEQEMLLGAHQMIPTHAYNRNGKTYIEGYVVPCIPVKNEQEHNGDDIATDERGV